MQFPKDFKKKKHPIVKDSYQWLLHDANGIVIISIIGGGFGQYGDGKTTFEMFDFSEENPRGYMSKQDINAYLKTKFN